MLGYAYVAILTAITLLSLKTLVVLRGAAPWTSAGWALTIGYDCAATYEALARAHLPAHVPYLCLLGLTVAFVVAGVRDEPQGDPWWWPSHLALTRAQRRSS